MLKVRIVGGLETCERKTLYDYRYVANHGDNGELHYERASKEQTIVHSLAKHLSWTSITGYTASTSSRWNAAQKFPSSFLWWLAERKGVSAPIILSTLRRERERVAFISGTG